METKRRRNHVKKMTEKVKEILRQKITKKSQKYSFKIHATIAV
jgi:hypothetical protein